MTKTFEIDQKLVCITLDFEKDYDDFIGEFNIFHSNKKELQKLINTFKNLEVPVSVFIRTDLLLNYPKSVTTLKNLGQDFHCHSHTHVTKNFKSDWEISKSMETFRKIFKKSPIGYRAPLGVLQAQDIRLLKKHGFLFSSSVFPSFRPQKFNNLSKPTNPFIYPNGIIEFPLAVVPKIRSIISLSYLKLFGLTFNKILFSIFGLPKVIVFDSHLHDFIVNEESFNKLSPLMKLVWGRNKYMGVEYFVEIVDYLKSKDYKFITMTQLYEHVTQQNIK